MDIQDLINQLQDMVLLYGYLWIPRVMEYRKSKDDWWGEDIGWLKNSNGVFKVIAWMPLPKPYEPQESEERP